MLPKTDPRCAKAVDYIVREVRALDPTLEHGFIHKQISECARRADAQPAPPART